MTPLSPPLLLTPSSYEPTLRTGGRLEGEEEGLIRILYHSRRDGVDKVTNKTYSRKPRKFVAKNTYSYLKNVWLFRRAEGKSDKFYYCWILVFSFSKPPEIWTCPSEPSSSSPPRLSDTKMEIWHRFSPPSPPRLLDALTPSLHLFMKSPYSPGVHHTTFPHFHIEAPLKNTFCLLIFIPISWPFWPTLR